MEQSSEPIVLAPRAAAGAPNPPVRARAGSGERPSRPRSRSRLRVALYHHISEGGCPLTNHLNIATSPEHFEAHVRRLARDYDLVALDDVIEGRLPERPLLLTFDDGYRSVLDVGAPILREMGAPSVFFISTGIVKHLPLPLDNLLCFLANEIGLAALEGAITGCAPRTASVAQLLDEVIAPMPYEPRLGLIPSLADRFRIDPEAIRSECRLFLEPGDLPRLAEAGIEVGNHTRSHVHCRSLDGALAAKEIIEHQAELEELAGQRVRSFSFPYGSRMDVTAAVDQALRESGHEAIFLVEGRINPAGHHGPYWHRISMQNQPAATLRRRIEILPRIREAKARLSGSGSGPIAPNVHPTQPASGERPLPTRTNEDGTIHQARSTARKRIIILTRDEPEHRYVANLLCERLPVEAVVVDVRRRRRSLRRAMRHGLKSFGSRLLLQAYLRVTRDESQRAAAIVRVLGEELTARFNLPHERIIRINGVGGGQCRAVLATVRPDLLLVYGTSIVPPAVLELARDMALNMHTGLSPRYRGTHCAFWPLANGEPEFIGATVHACTAAIDGGRIFQTSRAALEPGDDLHACFARAVKAGADAYVQVVERYLDGDLDGEPQDLSQGREYRGHMRTLGPELKARFALRRGLLSRRAGDEPSDVDGRRDRNHARS